MIAVLLTLCVGVCYGQIDEAHFNATSAHNFHELDANGDGSITLLEFHQSFNKYDINGNGKVDRHEYTEAICAQSPEMYQYSHYMYDEFDADHDHSLEASDYDFFFPKMDTNGDGMIDYTEYTAFGHTVAQKLLALGTHHEIHNHGHSQCH